MSAATKAAETRRMNAAKQVLVSLMFPGVPLRVRDLSRALHMGPRRVRLTLLDLMAAGEVIRRRVSRSYVYTATWVEQST